MKRWKVFAERIVVEETEVEADTEAEAYAAAQMQDNDKWVVSHDADWQVTLATEVTE